MPAANADGNILLESSTKLDYERLRLSLRDAASGSVSPLVTEAVLAEISSKREQIASPLDAETIRRPDSEDRAKLSGLSRATLTLPARNGLPPQHHVPLSAEHMAVALSLSTELDINELDAALLLVSARTTAVQHPDMNVVSAAKQLFDVDRRESVHYLQELLRAPLIPTPVNAQAQNFLEAVVHERDILVTQHKIISKIVARMQSAIKLNQTKNGNARNALREGEAVLLAECLFLLTYTVQVSNAEARSIRELLDNVAALHEKLIEQESQAPKQNRWTITAPDHELTNGQEDGICGATEIKSVARVELESVRNLVLLSWICTLDRSRYQDVYDPRTGNSNINLLLRDEAFIRETSDLPPLGEEGEDKVCGMDQAVMAGELAAAVFRLAVANPDEAEAITSAVRVSAYGDALSYLANDLPSWIENGAGSLCPDADLYADALEDLALDMAEAPNLANSLISFTQNEIVAAASEAAFATFDEGARVDEAHYPSPSPQVFPPSSPSAQINFGESGFRPGSTPKPEIPAASPSGKPPRPPSHRPPSLSHAGLPMDSTRQNAFQLATPNRDPDVAAQNGTVQGGSAFRFRTSNLIALLARFAARAIKLAPGKLAVDSISNGPRYWVAVGAPGNGLIPRIGDAVIDLWDVSAKNAYAPVGIGQAFVEALDAFLCLLTASAGPDGSTVHASAALRYLCVAGHPVVNLDLTSRALQHFNDLLSSPATPRRTSFDDAEVDALCGILNVITASAEGLKLHGGVGPILAGTAKDLPIRIASLAVHDVSPKLKAALVAALAALDDKRSISLFLENASMEKASSLRRLIRAYEGETGDYDVTVRVLQLTEACTKWPEEDYPEGVVDAIAAWFGIEEVLLNWSRRKYSSEFQRWSVIRAAASLLFALTQRSKPNDEQLLLVLGRLLLPAPGTGAASSALRALVAASGLLRYPEDSSRAMDRSHPAQFTAKYMQAWGRQLLVQTADHGLGAAYREMEATVAVCSRVITRLFEIPPGLASSIGLLVASAGELLVAETISIAAASTMVFSVNCSFPNAYKAGYAEESCRSVLAMLATAAAYCSNICTFLARDAPELPHSAVSFRTSLADIVAQGGGDFEEQPAAGIDSDVEPRDEPVMHSALRIVEHSLGSDGGSPPGLFLLGLHLDSSGRYVGADYGVLGALIELVAGASASSGFIDSKTRATASVFLQRLVANTVRRTARAVLEHIKTVGESDSWIRGGGFADEMLFRILEYTNSRNVEDSRNEDDVNWRALGEFASSSMSLSALQVRIFPEVELERSLRAIASTSGRDQDANDLTLSKSFNGAPSPAELFGLLELMARCETHDVVFDAFRSWYLLLGVRVKLYAQRPSESTVPLFLELAALLLNALASNDGSNELATLLRKDGGQIASCAVLTCVQHICETRKSFSTQQQVSLDEFQVVALLRGILRAIAGLVGTSSDVSRARTSLYASFLKVGQLVEALVSDEGVARAFGGRIGLRQVSGTEVVLSAACIDAASGATAATMAVALATACWTTHLDPIRAIPALSAQNRLRRIIASTIADAEARSLIGRACSRSRSEGGNSEPHLARERAAVVVGEAALSLIQSISTSSNGSRALVDSGCVEALVSLLTALETSRRHTLTMESQDTEGNMLGNKQSEVLMITHDDGDEKMDEDEDSFYVFQAPGPGEKRASLVASISSAIAAAMTSSDSILVDGALGVLEKGNGCFTDVLRMIRSGRPAFLESLSALSLILSRIPSSVMVASVEAGQLRLSLAGALNVFVSARKPTQTTQPPVSSLGSGFLPRKPLTAKEARQMKIWHPYGGSLFERDVAAERVSCLHSVMAALRPPSGLLDLFKTSLGSSHIRDGVTFIDQADRNGTLGSHRKIPEGDLMDVVRICRASLSDIQRFSEESFQANALGSGEASGSLSAQKLAEFSEFCVAKYGLSDSQSAAGVVSCMQKESEHLRGLANRCISIFESALFILREYMRSARGAVRGEPNFDLDVDSKMNSISAAYEMTASEAQSLLEQARAILLPLCKEIDVAGTKSWGSKDPSFCKQLSRQIRAYIGR